MSDNKAGQKVSKDAGELKAKRVYVRKQPATVYEVLCEGKSLALFLTRSSADGFAANAGNIALAIGGKLGKCEVRERTANP